jgi:uncharacterized protein YbjT (DUF2867 family)
MKAIIFGSTGLIGANILKLLNSSNEFTSITSFVRKRSDITPTKVKEIVTDFQNIEEFKDEFACDVCFISLGTTIKQAGSQEKFKEVDYTLVFNIATLCKNMDVKSVLVVSSLGADPNSSVFYSRIKGEMERDVSKMELNSLYFFRPSLLLGDRKDFRIGEKVGEVISGTFSFFFVGGLKKYKPISAEIVAKAMLRISLLFKTGIHFFESDEISDLDAVISSKI